MKLVIVESPSKAKTINKYLGPEYKVISSVGHIIDLPKSKLGVDVEKDYEPQYETIPGKEKVIRELKSSAKNSDAIILATDPDREGEAISWHIKNTLKTQKKPISRIVFHEITKDAVNEALQHPRDVDMNLVDAQQARRVLDRLVGYTLSPLIWKKIRYGLSAGRVQSVALKLIVDRERERQAFKPEEYWSIRVMPTEDAIAKYELIVNNERTGKGPKPRGTIHIYLKDSEQRPEFTEEDFVLELKKVNDKKSEVKTRNEFDEISTILTANEIKILALNEKTINKKPNPPFTTSTFQQAAVNVLGMTSRSAMRSAQKLYEAGLITYMRTDSFFLSNQAINNARKVIGKDHGSKYLPEKPIFYKTSSKSAQEAHEAIRPTDFGTKALPKQFGPQEQKVYDLIYRRALASQMEKAIFTQKSIIAEVTVNGHKTIKRLEFSATAQKCEFDGWMRLYKVSENKKLLKIIESLNVGSSLRAEDIIGMQHFTEPPARYTEASLIKALEKYGIGRPSTYASIVSVIMQRTYVEKEGKYFYPTDTGIVVTDMLSNHFKNIVDIDFTANMENDLDNIAEGKSKWQPIVGEFFIPFQSLIKKKDKELKKEDFVVVGESDEKCDICGKPMVRKIGRFGTFLSCIDFPKCQGIKSLDGQSEESIKEKVNSDEFKNTYLPAPKTDDGRDYILKKGRFGEFWAHPDYPKVKDAKPLEYTPQKIKELFGTAPKAKDGKRMVLRSGKYGKFWAHPDYPNVKEIVKIKKKQKVEEGAE